MIRSFLIFCLSFSWLFSLSQSKMEVIKENSWTIKWNKKVLLQTSRENETDNIKKIKKADLSKKYYLEITYIESDPAKEKERKRSFLFYGNTDNKVLRKDSTLEIKIPAGELKKLFNGQKKIRIYTMAIPTDPDLAARVRIRRVHLCTLELQ